MTENLWTTREVAEFLGLSPASVLRRWRAGDIPGFRLSSNCLRFDPDDIRAWLVARRAPGAGARLLSIKTTRGERRED